MDLNVERFNEHKLNKIMDFTTFDGQGDNPDDCNGHGTHVAGIISGTGNEKIIYSGYAPDSRLNIYKVLIDCTRNVDTPNLLRAIPQAVNDNVDVINLSLAIRSHYMMMVEQMANEAFDDGIAVVAAAGNNNGHVASPASAHKVLGIGASYKSDPNTKTSYSSFGIAGDTRIKPDLVAPVNKSPSDREGIISTDLGTRSYSAISGTSFAAPQISGAIADLIEKYRRMNVELEPGRLYAIMLSQATGDATNAGGLRMSDEVGAGALSMRYTTLETTSNQMSFHGLSPITGGATQFPINVPSNAERLTIAVWWPRTSDTDADIDLLLFQNSAVVASSTLNGQVLQRLVVDNPATGNGAYDIRILTNSAPTGQVLYYAYTFIMPNTPPSMSIRSSDTHALARVATPTEIPLRGSDDDADIVTFFVSGNPRKGSISPESAFNQYLPATALRQGTLTYTSNPGADGRDTFTITPWDGKDRGRPTTFTVTILEATPVTFTSEFSGPNQITLTFSEPLDAAFDGDNFELSVGSVTGVQNFGDSVTRRLATSGIPANTDVTVTYVQTTPDTIRSTASSELIDGTSSVTEGMAAPIENLRPIVDPIAIQFVTSGDTVTLLGSATDPNNDRLGYLWEQKRGQDVTLSDPTILNPTFTAPDVSTNTILRFELTATELDTQDALSRSRSASVHVRPEVPGITPVVLPLPFPQSSARFGESLSDLGENRLLIGAPDKSTPVLTESGLAMLESGSGSVQSEVTVSFGQYLPENQTRQVGFLFDANTGKRITDDIPIYDAGEPIDPALRHIITDESGTMRIFEGLSDGLSGESGKLLATLLYDGTVYLYDFNSDTLVAVSVPNDRGIDFGISIDGSDDATKFATSDPRLITNVGRASFSNGIAFIYDVADLPSHIEIPNPHPPSRDRFGSTVAMIGDDMMASSSLLSPTLDILFTNGTLYHSITELVPGQTLQVSDMEPDGEHLLLIGDSRAQEAYLYNVTSKSLINTFVDDPPAASFGRAVSTYVDKYAVSGSNSVYVFDKQGNNIQKIDPPSDSGGFGESISFVRGKILVGSPGTDLVGIRNAGAAYLYSTHSGSLIETYLNIDPNNGEEMGETVEYAGGMITVGIPGYRSLGVDRVGAVLLYPDINNKPVSEAGDDIIASEGATVTLNGTAYDPDGDVIASYLWSVTDSATHNIELLGSGNTATFVAPNVSKETVMTFGLVASDGLESSDIDTVSVRITDGATPSVPANLVATQLDATSIRITWVAPSEDITGYRIERSVSSQDYTVIASNVTNTAYTDTNLSPSEVYSYRVSAINANGIGNPTESVSAQINTILIITAPEDITAEAAAPLSVLDIGMATTNRDAVITNDAPDAFPLGNTTITWTATDDSGNSATDTQLVTIQDTTIPEFYVLIDGITTLTYDAGGTTVDFETPQASDNTDLRTSCSPASGQVFPIGVTPVSCTATDEGGNSAVTSFDVTIRLRNDPPVMTAPIPDFNIPMSTLIQLLLDTNFYDVDKLTYTVTIDSPDIVLILIYENRMTLTTLTPGSAEITVCADDGTHEPVCQMFVYTVIALDGLTIGVPNDITAEATGPLTELFVGFAYAASPDDPNPVITNDAPDAFPLGTTTVTWTATDRSGNISTDTQTVTNPISTGFSSRAERPETSLCVIRND